MITYQYKAVNATGESVKGILEADNEIAARAALRAKALIPLKLKSAKKKSTRTLLSQWREKWFTKRVSTAALALFTRQFATLLSASLPLEEALFAVAEQTETKALKHILFAVRESVREGHALGVSLEAYPSVFSHLYVSTISAGERTGQLDQVLMRLADYTEKQAEISQKIKTASIYPAMIVLIAFSIVGFLLSYVVPKMVTVYSHLKQDLPWMTQLLIGISDGVQSVGIYLLILLILMFIALQWAIARYPVFQMKWHRALLKLPLLGYGAKSADTARFARTLAILSGAGVPMLEGMRVASQLIQSVPIRLALESAIQQVREGSAINTALKKTGYFSPMSIHMIASGEASGQLEAMLLRVAVLQETELTRFIEVGLALFEPAVILLMGAIVLFIVLAVLLPIFQLNDFMG